MKEYNFDNIKRNMEKEIWVKDGLTFTKKFLSIVEHFLIISDNTGKYEIDLRGKVIKDKKKTLFNDVHIKIYFLGNFCFHFEIKYFNLT